MKNKHRFGECENLFISESAPAFSQESPMSFALTTNHENGYLRRRNNFLWIKPGSVSQSNRFWTAC